MYQINGLLYVKLFISCLLIFLLNSCASYRDIAYKSKDILSGDQVDNFAGTHLYEQMQVVPTNRNYLLYSQFLGRIYFVNDSKNSINYYDQALQVYQQLDDKAILNAQDVTATTLSSTLLDDNVMDYKGSDFERVFVHFYNALNYMSLNQLSSAMVEVRASENIQQRAKSQRNSKVYQIENSINKIEYSSDLHDYLAESQRLSQQGYSAFLNPYVYYIAGNIRELNNDYNDALVDYKLAQQAITQDNQYLLADLLRLSQRYDSSYYQRLKQQYPSLQYKKIDNHKVVLIIYEQDFLPKVSFIKPTIVIGDTLASVSLPVYLPNAQKVNQVIVIPDNQQQQKIQLELILDVMNLANNKLLEERPRVITRQISRLITKISMQHIDTNNNSQANTALAITGVLSSLLETADTRSFELLPRYVQVGKLYLAPSAQKLTVYVKHNKLDITLGDGKFQFLHIIDTGQSMYYNFMH